MSCPDVEVYERSASHWDEEFRRKARIACQAINVHKALWPKLRHLPAPQLYGYVSHRLLRWASPFTLAIAGLLMLSAVLSLGFIGALLILAGLGVLALGGLTGLLPVRMIPMALISFAGVGSGVIESVVMGHTYVSWTPAGSVRG